MNTTTESAVKRQLAETFDQFEEPATRIARWEAAALAAGREVDRNALRAYIAVADAEQQVLADGWAHAAAAADAEIVRLKNRVRELERETSASPLSMARVQALRDAAEICDEAAAVYAERGADDPASGANTAAAALFALMERFQRKADEAEYVATPCSVGGCEPGGEPCSTHERLMAHAEGDHELCEPDCVAPTPCDRCNGTAIDPEHSAADGIDGPAYLEPCGACQLATP